MARVPGRVRCDRLSKPVRRRVTVNQGGNMKASYGPSDKTASTVRSSSRRSAARSSWDPCTPSATARTARDINRRPQSNGAHAKPWRQTPCMSCRWQCSQHGGSTITPAWRSSTTAQLVRLEVCGWRCVTGGIRTPDPRFRRHIPQSTTRGFTAKYSPNQLKNVHSSSWVFNTISTSISTLQKLTATGAPCF
jgi:hypothetical protein